MAAMGPARTPSRRALLTGAFAAGGLLAAPRIGRAQAGRMDEAAFARLGAVEAVAGLKARRFTLSAYLDALVERAQRLKFLNAYITQDAMRLKEQAAAVDRAIAGGRAPGLLAGLPLAIKDNIDTAELPTTAGTPALEKWQPKSNAWVLQALLDNGAIVLGKANMHELAFGITSNNRAFGPVGNPYDRKMIPGGSSGGTAAAIVAGLAPAGLGSDTGGSCRIPAALCGCVGFRPTLGRYARAGVVPLSATRDTVGPLGRTVADIELLDGFCAIDRPSVERVSLKGVKLGVPRGYFYADLDRGLAATIEESLKLMKAQGAVLVEADIPNISALNGAVSVPVVLYEVLRELAVYLARGGSSLNVRDVIGKVGGSAERGILQSQLGVDAVPATSYRQALVVDRPKLQAGYASYFKKHGLAALVVPTTPLPARPIGQDETVELNGKQAPTFPTYIRNTDPPSNAGLPALSVPAGMAGGLPVGLEFVGPEGSDARLLGIGKAFEAARPPLPQPKF
jgi:indoleacetamide hydrolase